VLTYRIALPDSFPLLNANDRLDHLERARMTIGIREASRRIATDMRIPSMARVHVRGIYHYPDNRRRDPGNLAPSMKPMIDGMVRAGIIPDDSDEYLTDHGIDRGYPNVPGGRLILEVVSAEGVLTDYRVDVKSLFLKGKL
jgi:hypothetical protein